VKNIPAHITQADLLTMFKEFGPVSSLKLMTSFGVNTYKIGVYDSHHSGLEMVSKGFGFVVFDHHEVFDKSLKLFNLK